MATIQKIQKVVKLESFCLTDGNEIRLHDMVLKPKSVDGWNVVSEIFDHTHCYVYDNKNIKQIEWMRHESRLFVKVRCSDGSIMSTYFRGVCRIYHFKLQDFTISANEVSYLSNHRANFPDVFAFKDEQTNKGELVEYISFSKDVALLINGHSFVPIIGTNGRIFGEIRFDSKKYADFIFNVNYQSATKTIHRILWHTWKECSCDMVTVQIRFTDKTRIGKEFRFLLGQDTPFYALSEFVPLGKLLTRKQTTNKIDIFEKMTNEVEELLDQTKLKPLTDEQLSRIKQLIEIKTLMSNSKFI